MEFLVSIMFSVSYIANYGSSTVATEPRVSGHSRDRGTAGPLTGGLKKENGPRGVGCVSE